MHFLTYPTNLEAMLGPEGVFRASLDLSAPPDGFSTVRVWAARTPEALSPQTLVALAKGDLVIPAYYDPAFRQDGPYTGLRELADASATAGGTQSAPVLNITGSLVAPLYDMALNSVGSPSYDTAFQSLLERGDLAWLLAVTILMQDGTVQLCTGGLEQQKGQEHLASVWLSPSNATPLLEIANWLVDTVRSLKPHLDARTAALLPPGGNPGQSYAVKAVEYSEGVKPDVWPVLFISPGRASENPEGISAPDRREQTPVFNIRIMSYSDNAADNTRLLTQIADTLVILLNTRHYRSARLPSGNYFDLAFASNQQYGKTQDDWDDGVDVTWSCSMIKVGAF